jgi:hypothetical protein
MIVIFFGYSASEVIVRGRHQTSQPFKPVQNSGSIVYGLGLHDSVDLGGREFSFGGGLLDSIGVYGRVPFVSGRAPSFVDSLVQPVESLLFLGTLGFALPLSGSAPWHRTCQGNEEGEQSVCTRLF